MQTKISKLYFGDEIEQILEDIEIEQAINKRVSKRLNKIAEKSLNKGFNLCPKCKGIGRAHRVQFEYEGKVQYYKVCGKCMGTGFVKR